MAKVFLGLGANIGDCLKTLAEARIMIEKEIGKILLQSAVYRSEPWGFDSKDWFYNQVLVVEISELPENILKTALFIEKSLGRERHQKTGYESRTMDIDILFYENKVVDIENLQIPHPHIQERLFVLKPLCEIAPDQYHPILRKSMVELLDECPDKSIVEKLK